MSVSGTYSFELVEGEEQQAEMIEEGTGTLAESPRAVMPDTLAATVDAWNAEAGVSLVVVSKRETCGARVSDGEVDFLACAGMLERLGGGGCGWTMHELGGKDSKKRMVVKMYLPESGEAYAIFVKSSGSTIQRPKIFSLPILLKADLPYPKTIEWDLLLLSFKFKAREWKLFIKAYQGPCWFALVWARANERGPQEHPLSLEIPQYVGHTPDHESRRSNQANELPPKTLSGIQFFAARSNASVQSVRSGKEDLLPATSCLPAVYERLAPIIRQIQSLETRAATLDDSLPRSFGLIRGEMKLIWKDLEDLCEKAPSSPREEPSGNLFQSRAPPPGLLPCQLFQGQPFNS